MKHSEEKIPPPKNNFMFLFVLGGKKDNSVNVTYSISTFFLFNFNISFRQIVPKMKVGKVGVHFRI